ncbi:DUF4267 domain-containing protein [Nocardia sp. XZ_19_231]|uniref:DUF4267 domain-containing protein n=1 Tax=Nocardia sp. XZ_19_231 TaxID=2769252 RepID=UPI001E494CA6|nr:DUF4267 domain-containing protein [Nocardia sp. XZ_19_231]
MAQVLGILLVTGHRRALGWVLLVEALAAYGDMTNVLAHHLGFYRRVRSARGGRHTALGRIRACDLPFRTSGGASIAGGALGRIRT